MPRWIARRLRVRRPELPDPTPLARGNTRYYAILPGPANLGLVEDSVFSLFVVAYDLLVCSDPAMPAGCPANLNSESWVMIRISASLP